MTTTTTKKVGEMFRLELTPVSDGIRVTVTSEPALVASFKLASTSSRRAIEANRKTTTGSHYVFLPRAASTLLEVDKALTPFLFQENPTTLTAPVSRTKQQLVRFAKAAQDFVATWYESRLQPVTVTATVTVRLSDPVETEVSP